MIFASRAGMVFVKKLTGDRTDNTTLHYLVQRYIQSKGVLPPSHARPSWCADRTRERTGAARLLCLDEYRMPKNEKAPLISAARKKCRLTFAEKLIIKTAVADANIVK
jgi:hypothetical protein